LTRYGPLISKLQGDTIFFAAASRRKRARCPYCGHFSSSLFDVDEAEIAAGADDELDTIGGDNQISCESWLCARAWRFLFVQLGLENSVLICRKNSRSGLPEFSGWN